MNTTEQNSYSYLVNRWHNHYIDNMALFCTVTVNEWQNLLNDKTIPIIYDEWDIARKALDVKIMAYCIMPNHIHMLIWSEQGVNCKKFLHRVNSISSKKLQQGGGFWKERPRVFPIYSREVFDIKLEYIHNNPVKAGLIEHPAEWLHSSYNQLECLDRKTAFQCDDCGDVLPYRRVR